MFKIAAPPIIAGSILCALQAATGPPASALDQWVELTNNTRMTVVEIYISHIGAQLWDIDLLCTDFLAPASSVWTSIDDAAGCRFDFKTVFDDGTTQIDDEMPPGGAGSHGSCEFNCTNLFLDCDARGVLIRETAMNSGGRWYVASNGSRRGPLSDDELAALVHADVLKPTDLIWRPGSSGWKPAGEIPDLLAPPPFLHAAGAGGSPSPPKLVADAGQVIATPPRSDASRMALLVMTVIAALAVAAGVLVYLNRGPEYAISAEVFKRLPPKTQQWVKHLNDEPCNRTLASQLVNSLLDKAEYGSIIAFSGQTETKCGPDEELWEAVFIAQLRSSDFVGAERTADKLVAEYPADPKLYGWRAEPREKRSNFAGAYADMRTALSLFLDPSNVALQVYYDLARLAAKAGHPCEAVVTLRDYIAFHPERRRTGQLTTLMRGWQSEGSCAPLSGTGSALLRFDPNATAVIVSVKINGVPARMIVDTGATRTTLSKQLASRAGIEPSGPQGAIVTTPLGKTWLPGGRADHISVGGASLSDVSVFILNSAEFGDGVDGLLGLSFLGNFQVRIDGGALELRPAQ